METTTVENKEVTLISKGYEFLRQLCSFNADYTAFGKRPSLVTNRVAYIQHQLEAHKIPFTTEYFKPIAGVPVVEEKDVIVDGFATCFVNVIVEIEGTNKDVTTVFLAHHDVNNKASENCQDNTASIANLLDLCVRLSKNKPANNVVIAFVDAEEIVRPSICGSQRLAQNILSGKYGNVKYAVNLELTANGRNYWMSYLNNANVLADHIRNILPTTHRVRTPYNDSFVMEKEGVSSVCIGSLNDWNMQMAKTKGYCATWAMCHREEDTFDSQAIEGDMDLFMNYLESLI